MVQAPCVFELDPLDGLPGEPPAVPPWGQAVLSPGYELIRRVTRDVRAAREVVVVLGAGGAFAPDLIGALLLRGTGCVIGVDVQLTYPVAGAGYRHLNMRDGEAVAELFRAVRRFAAERGLELGTTYDLSTIQTSPNGASDRASLCRGKEALLAALRETEGDARLFYMSTAEVYGAPEGAPYAEDHVKAPFNAYGRAKWAEEQRMMAAHGAPTRGGRLRVCALRSWTICMVVEGEAGEITAARNYNDPFITVAERLARFGARLPVVHPALRAQLHFAEEVAEACVLLGSATAGASTWGRAYNCPGRAATHGQLRDVCHDVFAAAPSAARPGRAPWWAAPARIALRGGRLPRPLFAGTSRSLELLGGLLGARDMASRLPFLYRSTDVDSSALRSALGGQLTEPEGSSSEEAVRRLALGIRQGGPDGLNFRRYRAY